jgi:anaerobic magnesium-protoporphyrin IX monomethyl ester cyclase
MLMAFIRPMAQANRYIQNVPLNYVHMAAWLREHGHSAQIFDHVFDDVTHELVDTAIRERRIRVVGIGCMTCEFPQAVEEAKRLKNVHPDLKIVFGGAHPSGDPEECLATGAVDYVIVGEGEIALTALLDVIEVGKTPAGIPGLWSVNDGHFTGLGVAAQPDVTTLPLPAYDLLDLEKYFHLDSPWHFPKSNRVVQMITSRGCPYHCSYCHEIHGKKYRGQPPERVLDEMEYLSRKLGVEELMVVDDIFNFDLERAKVICRGIVERGLNMHLQFPNGVRGDRFDEELVDLMAKAGTHFMAIAIETTSEKFQNLIRKHLKVEKAMQTVRWGRQHGIEVSGFFMIGFPGETREEVQKTIDFALTAPLDSIFVSIVSPFKGTVMRTDIQEGRFGQMNQAALDGLEQLFPVVHNDTLSAEELRKIQRNAYWRFYTKPRSLVSLAKRMTNRHNLQKVFRAVRKRAWNTEVVSVN